MVLFIGIKCLLCVNFWARFGGIVLNKINEVFIFEEFMFMVRK